MRWAKYRSKIIIGFIFWTFHFSIFQVSGLVDSMKRWHGCEIRQGEKAGEHIQVAFTTSFKILTSILQSNPIYVWLLLLRILYRLPLWKKAYRLSFKITPHKNLKDSNT